MKVKASVKEDLRALQDRAAQRCRARYLLEDAQAQAAAGIAA